MTITNDKQRREHTRLLDLWATGKATRAQMLRCMELGRFLAGDYLRERPIDNPRFAPRTAVESYSEGGSGWPNKSESRNG
jgi:hypothetical protein